MNNRALKIYVCNVATQQGETEGYSVEDHIKALNDHVGAAIFDIIVINNSYESQLPAGTEWVKTIPETESEYPLYRSDLVDHIQPWRHDSSKLARVIIDLYQERTGPLIES